MQRKVYQSHSIQNKMCWKEDEVNYVTNISRNKEGNNILPSISEQCIWFVKPKLWDILRWNEPEVRQFGICAEIKN